jgi:hypothetical protein
VARRGSAEGPGPALALYAPVHGVLRSDPDVPDGPPRPEEFAAELTAGQAVLVVASADQDDPPAAPTTQLSLELRRDGATLATDDDGAGSGERELVYAATRSGRYLVRVSAPAARSSAVRFTVIMYPAEQNPRSARVR